MGLLYLFTSLFLNFILTVATSAAQISVAGTKGPPLTLQSEDSRGHPPSADFIKSLDSNGHLWRASAHPSQCFLVSFLQFLPETEATPSRTQSLVMQSMETQYGSKGLSVVVIDQEGSSLRSQLTATSLDQIKEDWGMSNLVMLTDTSGSMRRKFNVNGVPTVFLLDSRGRELKRWNHPIEAATLAKLIKEIIH